MGGEREMKVWNFLGNSTSMLESWKRVHKGVEPFVVDGEQFSVRLIPKIGLLFYDECGGAVCASGLQL